jgi:hypothetical protein
MHYVKNISNGGSSNLTTVYKISEPHRQPNILDCLLDGIPRQELFSRSQLMFLGKVENE